MVDPATLAVISIGASAAGGILGAKSAKDSAKAQSQMYQYQAGVALMNKQIDLQNRDYALATGENEAVRFGMKAGQEKGALKAAQSASGIDVGSGTSVNVRAGHEKAVSMDLNTIRRNAARVAYGYEVQASQEEAQANLYGMASTNALAAGDMNAMASLISGAGSVADKWLKASTSGIPGFKTT